MLKSSRDFTSYSALNKGSIIYEIMSHEKGDDITYTLWHSH